MFRKHRMRSSCAPKVAKKSPAEAQPRQRSFSSSANITTSLTDKGGIASWLRSCCSACTMSQEVTHPSLSASKAKKPSWRLPWRATNHLRRASRWRSHSTALSGVGLAEELEEGEHADIEQVCPGSSAEARRGVEGPEGGSARLACAAPPGAAPGAARRGVEGLDVGWSKSCRVWLRRSMINSFVQLRPPFPPPPAMLIGLRAPCALASAAAPAAATCAAADAERPRGTKVRGVSDRGVSAITG
mmetsp:Transcript_26445/g.87706  ORF Transcript_26445/g.87706 Transcript_26445/m.87706 type:complete len:244 (-) Transcript_26445:40-771(-)